MKTVAYIPIKTNNERLKNKNTMVFHNGKPLIYFIQKTLLQIKNIDEIYIFCSDNNIRNYCLEGVQFLERPKHLDSSSTSPQEIIDDFIKKVKSDIYITAHATSPFVTKEHIDDCVKAVKFEGYDSAFTAKRLKKLLWSDKFKAINFKPNEIPRTQDLDPIYAEVSAAYVFKKEVFTRLNRRIGLNPKIIEVDEIEALDIDYLNDFIIADIIYKNIILKKGDE